MTTVVNRISRAGRRLKSNPEFVVMRVLGRFSALRRTVDALSPRRALNGHRYDPTPTLFPDVSVTSAVGELRREGLFRGLRLPPGDLETILEYARRTPCFAGRNPKHGFMLEGRKKAAERIGPVFTGYYFNTAGECPVIGRLERDSKILQIAEHYLGGPPVHQGNQMWWSFAEPLTDEQKSLNAQKFHFDLDDYRFVKFFFYITDVDADHGPHVCVTGTHRVKRLRDEWRLRRFDDVEIARVYGQHRVQSICAPAGSGFAEDTYCFHKGTPPVKGSRLVLQLEFGLHDYGLQSDVVDSSQLSLIA